MRTPPADLDPAAIMGALARRWDIRALRVEHRPVGFGSHHWLVDDGATRWWVTVDDLAAGTSADRTLDDVFETRRAAMRTAGRLDELRPSFVVAPVPAADGPRIVRLDARFAMAVFPFIDGRSRSWGDELSADELDAVVDVVAALHRVALERVPEARPGPSDFDHREVLERWGETSVDVGSAGTPAGNPGPYTSPAAELVAAHRRELASALARSDRLLAGAGSASDRWVLTHGEPHPGNLLTIGDRWLLIDWDSTRVAPPERDVAVLVSPQAHPGADVGRVLERYERLTGRALDPDLLEAYRLRWDLADVASYLHRFTGAHAGSTDDDHAWTNLQASLSRLAAPG